MRAYLYLGVVLMLALAVSAALWFRTEAIQAEAAGARIQANLDLAVKINETNEATLAKLRAIEIQNNKMTAELLGEIDKINEDLAAANAALADLKDKDENVRGYLGTPVPDGLRRLYNR